MPTYDYECETCGHRLEVFQSITEKPLRECPKCKGRLRRLIGSGGAIIFRGSGFYVTDYRSEEYRKKSKEESKPADKTKSSDSKEE
jgi:putative FmdB family regulatory protein